MEPRRSLGLGGSDGDDFLLAGNLPEQTLAGELRGRLGVDGEGVGGEIAKDAGEFVAALGAMREMVRDDGGFFGGEQLHGVEHQVVGLGMARAAGVGGAERRVGHDCRAHG